MSIKVLSIGSDRNIFADGSDVRRRIIEYGALFDELHIVVFSRRNFQFSISNFQTEEKISENVWIYSTNSRSKLLYIFDAYRIGGAIIENWKLKIGNCAISAQDPFEAGLAGWLLKLKTGIPLQLQIHTDFLNPFFKKESLLNAIRVVVAKFLFPRTDAIRVVSKRIQNSLIEILKINPSKITVLPIFVSMASYILNKNHADLPNKKKFPGKDFVLLMASRFSKEKNIEMAIEVMKDIAKELPRAILVIFGDGSGRQNYELRIKNYGLEDRITTKLWQEDIAEYYARADIFLLTSNYEGYGRTIIEAMAAGCPVIMTDVGIAGDIVENEKNGIIIPIGDTAALKSAILRLYQYPQKRADLITHGYETIEKLYPRTKEEYLKEYKNAMMKVYAR